MSNNHKIIGLYGALSFNVWGNFFQKKLFMGRQIFLGNLWRSYSKWEDKCSDHAKVGEEFHK